MDHYTKFSISSPVLIIHPRQLTFCLLVQIPQTLRSLHHEPRPIRTRIRHQVLHDGPLLNERHDEAKCTMPGKNDTAEGVDVWVEERAPGIDIFF